MGDPSPVWNEESPLPNRQAVGGAKARGCGHLTGKLALESSESPGGWWDLSRGSGRGSLGAGKQRLGHGLVLLVLGAPAVIVRGINSRRSERENAKQGSTNILRC